MDKYQRQILDHLGKPAYKPLTAASLVRRLKLAKQVLSKHEAALETLIEKGKVHRGPDGRLRLHLSEKLMVGVVKRTSRGDGFVIPHKPLQEGRAGDLYIAAADMQDAHSGDEVVARLLKRRRSGGRRCGRIEEVLIRATNTFVGSYFERDGHGYVQVDGNALRDPVSVGDPGAKQVQPDDKVVIEMIRFPTHYRGGEAVLTKVLGARGEPGIDVESIIHEFALPAEFPEAALEEARRKTEQFDESITDGRRDLTRETIITIDPADARDFDDAISLSRSDEGHWHLGVHIADVAHLVAPGGPLDAEAKKRGNSVYLPGRVLPMLPEILSNGLASLQSGKVRYVKSVFIEFTADGIPLHTEFSRSAIKVSRRLAYADALNIIQDRQASRIRVAAKVRDLLSRMHQLAMILRARRFAAGALELQLPEIALEFDKSGKVVGAHESEHDESHQIIEEFMLAANCAVATALADRQLPYLRRVHGDPDVSKLKKFAEFVSALGFQLKKYQSRLDLQALLNRVRGETFEQAVNFALLRSLKQAEYAATDLGHYALAVDNYCHFTSPIRRYPDLVIHRLVDAVLLSGSRRRRADEVELAKLGRQCSMTERRAAAAERELTRVKLLTYMAERIGDEFPAVITGVERFGIFCRGTVIPFEGMVHISALDRDDYFDFDQTAMSLVGRRRGRVYRLGEQLVVSVALVDVDRRELELRLVEQSQRSDRKARRSGNQRQQQTGGERGASRQRKQPREGQRGKRVKRNKPRR